MAVCVQTALCEKISTVSDMRQANVATTNLHLHSTFTQDSASESLTMLVFELGSEEARFVINNSISFTAVFLKCSNLSANFNCGHP